MRTMIARSRKIFRATFAGIFLSLLVANVASAHLLVALPDRFETATGGNLLLKAGLSEPLITFVYSRENLLALGYAGNVAKFSGNVFYADGTSSALADAMFTPANTARPASSDHDIANLSIQKTGTTIIAPRFDFNSGTRPTVATAKTFINWTSDGMATKRCFGNDAIEIVMAENISRVSVGDTLKVRVFLRGQPLPNATVSATYDGAPTDPNSDEPNENEYLHVDTDSNGYATFTGIDRANKWVIGIEFIDENVAKNNPDYSSYTDWKGIRYRGSILLPVVAKAEPSPSSGGSSSSGCDAGLGTFALIGLANGALLRRK